MEKQLEMNMQHAGLVGSCYRLWVTLLRIFWAQEGRLWEFWPKVEGLRFVLYLWSHAKSPLQITEFRNRLCKGMHVVSILGPSIPFLLQ